MPQVIQTPVLKHIKGRSAAAFRFSSRYGETRYIFSYQIPGDNDAFWDNHDGIYLIEIPKTASHSIHQYFDPKYSFGHIYGLDYPTRIRSKLRTIVRNPYDRLVSAYYFMIRGGFNNNPEYLQIKNDYKNFQDWVSRGLSRTVLQVGQVTVDTIKADQKLLENDMGHLIIYNGWREAFLPQTYWLLDEHGCLLIDKANIGKFENIKEDAKNLLGINLELHLNKSDDRDEDWRSYYTNSKVRDKVYALYKKDFKILGYDKDI